MYMCVKDRGLVGTSERASERERAAPHRAGEAGYSPTFEFLINPGHFSFYGTPMLYLSIHN